MKQLVATSNLRTEEVCKPNQIGWELEIETSFTVQLREFSRLLH